MQKCQCFPKMCLFSIGQFFGNISKGTTCHFCVRFQLDNLFGNAKRVTTLHLCICFQLVNLFGCIWMWNKSKDPMPLLSPVFLTWNLFAGVRIIQYTYVSNTIICVPLQMVEQILRPHCWSNKHDCQHNMLH